MSLDIKICGLSTRAAIDISIARGAAMVGFVFFEKSPRHLPIETMAERVAHVDRRAETVIVTVDPDDALLDRFTAEVKPDWLQLHGKESPERVAQVRALTGLRVMKALPVSSYEDLLPVEAYRGVADRLLLDSKRPKGSNLPGGNGVSFDWRILAALDPAIGFMLSGGLNAQNVAEALRIARPAGLDVSSGVENAPGVKDTDKLHGFFDALDACRADAA